MMTKGITFFTYFLSCSSWLSLLDINLLSGKPSFAYQNQGSDYSSSSSSTLQQFEAWFSPTRRNREQNVGQSKKRIKAPSQARTMSLWEEMQKTEAAGRRVINLFCHMTQDEQRLPSCYCFSCCQLTTKK